MTDTPPPRLAATILILRDRPGGMEVFMVERHHQIDFASGALVFPGGKIDDRDHQADLAALSDGADGLDTDALSVRIGAIREAFEEADLLFARDGQTGAFVDAARIDQLQDQRKALADGEICMRQFLTDNNLRAACDALVPFSNWITPKGMPKRFDTFFFLARALENQTGGHDGSESVDSTWITPADALEAAEQGRRTVIFPTRMNLKMLAESDTVEAALSDATARPVPPVEPQITLRDEKPFLTLPPDAGYGAVELSMDAVMKQGG